MQKNYSKEFAGQFRSHMIRVPEIIRAVPGIRVFGKRIKSLVFSTDVAIIRNIDADAVLAVYPFTPQPVITQAILGAADVPVFCGIGGGITRGKRVVNLAMDAEFKGAMGVVVNTPTENETIARVAETVDIPIIAKPNAGMPTITATGEAVYSMEPDEFAGYMKNLVAAGAGIIGGCCGTTPEYIRKVAEVCL